MPGGYGSAGYGGSEGGAPSDAAYLIDGSSGIASLTNEILVGALAANLTFATASTTLLQFNSSNNNVGIGGSPTSGYLLHINQPASTSGSPSAFVITGGAHTALATQTEAMDVLFDIGRTVQFTGGNFTTQRAISIEAPTYGATSSTTITNAATLHIGGHPVAGTSMTLSNPYALWIESQNNAIRLTNGTTSFQMQVGCSFINFFDTSSVSEISVDSNDNLFIWQKVSNRQMFIRSDLSNAASAAIQFRTNGANNRWAFRTEGHFVPSEDNTYDIGDDDANSGVRNIYFASATYLGGSAGGIGITQPAIDGGTRRIFTVTGGAHTNMATGVEAIDILFDIARTVQWAQGNITTQRAVNYEAPTWATATSSSTFANGVNVNIDSAPNAGTNCVFTALSALRVGSANVTVGATSAGLNYATVRVPGHTATVSGTTQVTASPGIAALSLGIISIDDGANENVTIDNGATLYIAGAPAATGGSTVTLTNAYSLWVDAGIARFDGNGTHIFEIDADTTTPGAAAGRIPFKDTSSGATRYLMVSDS
jgi:hypothetical protein